MEAMQFFGEVAGLTSEFLFGLDVPSGATRPNPASGSAFPWNSGTYVAMAAE
jgi:hypothetical protein